MKIYNYTCNSVGVFSADSIMDLSQCSYIFYNMILIAMY